MLVLCQLVNVYLNRARLGGVIPLGHGETTWDEEGLRCKMKCIWKGLVLVGVVRSNFLTFLTFRFLDRCMILQPANLVASRAGVILQCTVVTRGKVSVVLTPVRLLKERANPIRKGAYHWSTCTVKVIRSRIQTEPW